MSNNKNNNKSSCDAVSSINAIISGYSSIAKNSTGAKLRVYEKGSAFRLYCKPAGAKLLGLNPSKINKQGFISLNKLDKASRNELRKAVTEVLSCE